MLGPASDPLRLGLLNRVEHLDGQQRAIPSLGRIVRILPPDGPLPVVGFREADRVNAALRSFYDVNLRTLDADGEIVLFPGAVIERLPVAYPPGFLKGIISDFSQIA